MFPSNEVTVDYSIDNKRPGDLVDGYRKARISGEQDLACSGPLVIQANGGLLRRPKAAHDSQPTLVKALNPIFQEARLYTELFQQLWMGGPTMNEQDFRSLVEEVAGSFHSEAKVPT